MKQHMAKVKTQDVQQPGQAKLQACGHAAEPIVIPVVDESMRMRGEKSKGMMQCLAQPVKFMEMMTEVHISKRVGAGSSTRFAQTARKVFK